MKNSIIIRSSVAAMSLATLLSCSKNEEPGMKVPVATNATPVIQAQNFSISEWFEDDKVIGGIAATDAEGDALTFTIKTNDQNLFNISSSGDLGLAAGKSLDYDIATAHSITVTVSDGNTSADATVDIEVLNERTINIVNGLVADFQFDDSLKDSTDNEIIAAGLVGTYATAAGVNNEVDGALYLDGSSYINIQRDTLMVDKDATFTIMLHAKADNKNSQRSLFSKAFDYQLLVTPATHNLPTEEVFWAMGGNDVSDWGASGDFFIDRAFIRGDWVHYALVFGNNEVKVYINGTLRATGPTNISTIKDSGYDILIGAKEFPSNNTIGNHFKGSIADFKYFDQALSIQEIKNHVEVTTRS